MVKEYLNDAVLFTYSHMATNTKSTNTPYKQIWMIKVLPGKTLRSGTENKNDFGG